MKIYDLVKRILERDPFARNSDKVLLWEVWEYQGAVCEKIDIRTLKRQKYINKEMFLDGRLISTETITRARRKVQEIHKNLRASKYIQAERRSREKTKGLFIFKS
jgi:hypothetical protein